MGTIDNFIENGIADFPESISNVKFQSGSDHPVHINISTTQGKMFEVAKKYTVVAYMNYKEKEFLYKAIHSLLKKTDFLQLSLQLEEGQIDEEEFDAEIDQYEDKYVNTVSHLKNSNDLYVINSIVKNLQKNFSIDEVAELFSITTESIDTKALELK